MYTYKRDAECIPYRVPHFNTDASHTGNQIKNGSRGYKIKPAFVESHGNIPDDKKQPRIKFSACAEHAALKY